MTVRRHIGDVRRIEVRRRTAIAIEQDNPLVLAVSSATSAGCGRRKLQLGPHGGRFDPIGHQAAFRDEVSKEARGALKAPRQKRGNS
jgi:hypothetical protein